MPMSIPDPPGVPRFILNPLIQVPFVGNFVIESPFSLNSVQL